MASFKLIIASGSIQMSPVLLFFSFFAQGTCVIFLRHGTFLTGPFEEQPSSAGAHCFLHARPHR